MTVRVSTAWSYHGLHAIVLENTLLRVILLPQVGGKIWQITYKPTDRDLLWQHPRLTPRSVPFGAVYDDVFFGGWDELFPNDLPEEINGERLPDHGEVWTLPWNADVVRNNGDEVVLHLSVDTPISVVRIEKWITLRDGEAKLRMHHQISALSFHDQPFLWKLHAAMALGRDSRIDLPAHAMYVEDFGPPRNHATGVTYTWPYLTDDQGVEHDMRSTLPTTAQINEFQYATELTDGWCAITHPHERLGFGLAFDRRVLPACWLFATYGGWRGLSTVILEPCTGYGVSLAEGIRNGTHQLLHPGDTISCDVVATVFTGGSAVSAIDADGNVTVVNDEENH